MAFFDNSYAKIYYETYGEEGVPVVLVNGYTRPCRDFRQLASFLAGEGYRVLIFDNRGSGETLADSLETLGDIAFDLVSLTEFLGFDSFHLIGFSMGGVVARIVAHENPKLLRSLSLVSSPLSTEFVSGRSERPWGNSLESIESKLSGYVSREFWDKNELILKGMAKTILGKMKSGFKEGAKTQREALLKTATKFFSLKGLSLPTLLIHGSLDKVIPLEEALELREQKSDSEMHSYEGAGHLLLMEKSKELYRDLASFLRRYD